MQKDHEKTSPVKWSTKNKLTRNNSKLVENLFGQLENLHFVVVQNTTNFDQLEVYQCLRRLQKTVHLITNLSCFILLVLSRVILMIRLKSE